MKIKHWQGYGTVEAKKISKKTRDGITTLVVNVTGNHEWGLIREDMYDLKRWLVDRFDRSAKEIPDYKMDYSYVQAFVRGDNGCCVETCTYTFRYGNGEVSLW